MLDRAPHFSARCEDPLLKEYPIIMQEQQTPLRVFCVATPIIPAIRKFEFVDQAIAAHGKIVYLMS
jgi:hypothetical protein